MFYNFFLQCTQHLDPVRNWAPIGEYSRSRAIFHVSWHIGTRICSYCRVTRSQTLVAYFVNLPCLSYKYLNIWLYYYENVYWFSSLYRKPLIFSSSNPTGLKKFWQLLQQNHKKCCRKLHLVTKFPKVTNGHKNRFLKAAGNCITKSA